MSGGAEEVEVVEAGDQEEAPLGGHDEHHDDQRSEHSEHEVENPPSEHEDGTSNRG